MKKNYLAIIAVLFLGKINAQVAQVGIGTPDPTNTLDVNGTTRVRNLLPNTFDSNNDKIVVANPSGVLKAVPASSLSSASYEVLFDVSSLNTAVINDNNPNGDDTRTPVLIQNQSITLSKDAMVQINFSVPIFNVFKFGTTTVITDTRAKMLRTQLVVDNSVAIRATNTYTNSSTAASSGTPGDAEALKGIFYNTGSYFIKLSAGTHTIALQGTCNPYMSCTQGGNLPGTRFQAYAIY